MDVLLSIRPKWWCKILNHQKWLEIRKSAPKLATPFYAYIYVSGTGKILGRVLVNEVRRRSPEEIVREGGSCLTLEELKTYANGRPLYAWSISKVTLIRKPLAWRRPPVSWQYINAAAQAPAA